MPIEFRCDACSRLLRVPDGSGGQNCHCPACQKLLLIPSPPNTSTANLRGEPASSAKQLKITCPSCGHRLSCSSALVGTTGQCRQCQSIFTITSGGATPPAPANCEWVFNCPQCDQLFAGEADMEGRKGKCHTCGQVFAIELKPAQLSAFASNISTQPAPSQPTKASISADAPMRPMPAPRPSLPVSEPATIRFACLHCQGQMEVPGDTAGRTTQCPYCQQLLKIPANTGK